MHGRKPTVDYSKRQGLQIDINSFYCPGPHPAFTPSQENYASIHSGRVTLQDRIVFMDQLTKLYAQNLFENFP